MHRKYRPWHYEERIRKIRSAMPDAAIGADVMVGFPGESDELFEESRAFIESLPFTYLHVFTYSARPGTPAAEMADQVPVHVARERNRVLRDLAAEKNLAFRRSFIGTTIPAITLHRSDETHTEALTDNFLKLYLEGKHEANRWMQVKVTGTGPDRVVGETSQWKGSTKRTSGYKLMSQASLLKRCEDDRFDLRFTNFQLTTTINVSLAQHAGARSLHEHCHRRSHPHDELR
jgi:tRNA A37 methylthiotransferase MiaB